MVSEWWTTVTEATPVGARPVTAWRTWSPRWAAPLVATAPLRTGHHRHHARRVERVLDADPPLGPVGPRRADQVAAGGEAEVGVVEVAQRGRGAVDRPPLHDARRVAAPSDRRPIRRTSKAPSVARRARLAEHQHLGHLGRAVVHGELAATQPGDRPSRRATC